MLLRKLLAFFNIFSEKYEKEESSGMFQKLAAETDEIKADLYSSLKENYANYNLLYTSADDVDVRLQVLSKEWKQFNSQSDQVSETSLIWQEIN